MLIAVLGANGRTGRDVASAALERGWRVRGLVRDASAVEPLASRPTCDPTGAGFEVVQGDARNAADVRSLARGADAVVSTLGSHSGKLGPLYGLAALAMVDAMTTEGVRRVVVLSTRALGDTSAAGDPPDRRPASSPEVHADLRDMERVLGESGLDVTIMRPSRLVNGPLGEYEARERVMFPLGQETRRADLADAICDAVERGLWIGADVAIVSR